MSSASKHGEEAIRQDMHWCKAQLSLGSLGASEVTQEPVLLLKRFVVLFGCVWIYICGSGVLLNPGESDRNRNI